MEATGLGGYHSSMSGVTWDERTETDWLASNGRWYPQSSYPRSWDMTSLPPAPGHGQIGSILRRVTAHLGVDADLFEGGFEAEPERPPIRTKRPEATRSRPTVPRQQATRADPTPRQSSSTARATDRTFLPRESSRDATANAEVIAQRTYKPKVSPGPPPPAGLPPPPGRIRDVEGASGPPSPPAPSVPAKRSTQEALDLEVVAGDLGKVFGVAKKRIAKAINEAAESDR